jgi:hypothetical protein
MSYKTVGTQPQDKKGSATVAGSWEKTQSTSTKHRQPRHSVGKKGHK